MIAAAITRTRDRRTFLERAIRSVREQTMQDHLHVIVNDGGDRATLVDVLRSTGAASDPRVRVVHVDEPQGREFAANTGVRATDADYIALHDDDDTWHPEFLARAAAALTKSAEGSSGVVQGVVVRADQIQERVDDTAITELSRVPLHPRMRSISLFEQCSVKNQATPIAFLYSRRAFEAIGGYDETLDVVGDWDFGIRFLLEHDIDFLDPGFALAHYHRRPFDRTRTDNSSFAGNDLHRTTTTMLMNRYLRQELREGRLGVGYLMAASKHEDDRLADLARSVVPQRLISAVGRRWFSGR